MAALRDRLLPPLRADIECEVSQVFSPYLSPLSISTAPRSFGVIFSTSRSCNWFARVVICLSKASSSVQDRAHERLYLPQFLSEEKNFCPNLLTNRSETLATIFLRSLSYFSECLVVEMLPTSSRIRSQNPRCRTSCR